jgi:hypothetical protein
MAKLLFATLTTIAILSLEGRSQIYTVTTPLNGKMSLGVTDLNGGSTYVDLTFNNLTETIDLDVAGGTVRQTGFVSYTPSSSSTNMVIGESKAEIPAAITVTMIPPSVLSFDTGSVPITWNSSIGAYTLNGAISSFSGTFNASYSLVTGGATNFGSFTYQISQPLADYLVATTFSTLGTNGDSNSITLSGLNSLGGYGAQAGEYTSTPQIGADVTAANGFHMQLQPGEANWFGNICEYWFWSSGNVTAMLAQNVNTNFFVFSSSPIVGNGPHSVVAADVNGDGFMDLICANYYSGTLSILTNDSRGGFVLASSPMVGSNPQVVTAADVNGDGYVDLICADYGGNNLTVLTNDGHGGFVLASSPNTGLNPFSVTAADVNGDGKMDLISANLNDNTLTVLTNDGFGGFVLACSPTVGSYPESVAAADVNGNGSIELICANFNDNALMILTNDGNSIFGSNTTIKVGNGPVQVIAAKVTSDGNVDLICGNYLDNTLTVLTNNGNGGFGSNATYSVGLNPFFVTAADVNGDGKMDLISANSGDNTLTVLTNNGYGSFVLATSPIVGSTPQSVVAADVNGDGKEDLISANFGAVTLTVLTNATTFPPPLLPHTALGTASLDNGFVVSVNVTDGGYGYTNTPLVRLIGGGGSGAEAFAVVINGVVTRIVVTDAGHGYNTAPLIIIDPPFVPNPVLQISPMTFLTFSNITTGGNYQLQQFQSYYWANQSTSFTATNTLYSQMVAGVWGTGDFRLALSPVPAQAFATPQVVNGFVVGVTVTAGGSGYVTAPAINIYGDVGSNATAVASISSGIVTNISITEAGIGYTNIVTVQIDPPPAAAVSPSVQPIMRVDSANLAPYDNYQIQFTPALGETWGTWNGGLFIPTDVTNSQFLFITNGAGFFRVESVP